MGSFIMMNGNANPQKSNVNGTIIQSLDVLDFSVIHLSAYERVERRWARTLKLNSNDTILSFTAITNASTLLRSYSRKVHNQQVGTKSSSTMYLNTTVVIMPFLGSHHDSISILFN